MKEMTYDEKNIRKCENCPYNIGAKNCWVAVACHPYDYKI